MPAPMEQSEGVAARAGGIASGTAHVAEILAGATRFAGRASEQYARIALGIAATDAVAAMLATVVSVLIVSDRGLPARGWILVASAPAILLGSFVVNGLYRIPKLAPAEEFRRVISAVSVSVIGLGLLTGFVFRAVPKRLGLDLTVSWVVLTWSILLIFVLIERKLWHRTIYRLRRSGALTYRTLIVGTNSRARDIGRRLSPASGFHVVGMLAADGEPDGFSDDAPPVAGSVHDLGEVIEAWSVECLFIATPAIEPATMDRLLQTARKLCVEVRVAANLPDILASRLSLQTIGGGLVFAVDRVQLSGSQAFAKRAFGLAVGALTILVTLPVWLTAAILVRTTSTGSILFRQQRVGRHGHPFTIYKFRTMTFDAEERKRDLVSLSAGPLFKIVDDPRLTKVGRILRRWSVDELPQLLNVMKGDMTLVGPRPLVMFDPGEVQDHHLHRLEVLPGMTGLWQVSGRSDLTFDECLQLDTFYIENWSITYDLFILLRTVPAVLKKRGAY